MRKKINAEAIVEATLRPTIRFVEPKSVDQQARTPSSPDSGAPKTRSCSAPPSRFRTREQLVKSRRRVAAEIMPGQSLGIAVTTAIEKDASIRLVRRTAVQTTVWMITTGVMLALLAGIAIKLKIFGGGP